VLPPAANPGANAGDNSIAPCAAARFLLYPLRPLKGSNFAMQLGKVFDLISVLLSLSLVRYSNRRGCPGIKSNHRNDSFWN
jgi:hypothetical protein